MKIKSEIEYWAKHKQYKRKLRKLKNKFLTLRMPIDDFHKEFLDTLKEMEEIGLVSSEWAEEQRQDLYNKVNKPNEIRDKIERYAYKKFIK